MQAAPLPTRARLIAAATRLFQTQGYFATGVAEILVEANAPKGSLYHHFPGGKAALAVAAVEAISADVLAVMAKAQAKAMPPSQIVRALARAMADWLRRSGGAQGSLFSVLALECAPREPLVHEAVRSAYAAWRAALAKAIGADARRARLHADLVIAALEGGLILARVDGREAALLNAAEAVAALLET